MTSLASAGRLAPVAVEGLQDAAALSGDTSRAGHSTGNHLDELRAVTADAQAWFTGQAPDAPAWQVACAERGIDPASATRLGVGWAEDSWTGLTDHLHELGHSDGALVAAGVSKQARTGNLIDVFADRVTFPLTGPSGEVVGFTGRAITSGNNTPKYLNTAANPVFNKSETLYGTGAISPATRSIVITEGPWDAAAVTYATSGRHVGVAASGTAFTDAHAQQLAATGRAVTVWMDPDQAGQDAAVRAHKKLAGAGIHDARYTNTAVLDPSAFHEATGAAEVQATVTTRTIPLTQVVIDQKLDQVVGRDPHTQVAVVRELAPTLAYADKDTRGQLAMHISERTGLQATTVVDALTQGAPPPRGRPQAATTPGGRHPAKKTKPPRVAATRGRGR
jgi:DNA primase catalytic core